MNPDHPSPSESPEFDSNLPEGVLWQPELSADEPLELFIWQPDADALNAVLYDPKIVFPVTSDDDKIE